MIMIVDRSFKVLKMCRHEEEFCNYICHLKNIENKRIASDPESAGVKWGFTCYTHNFLEDFLEIRDEKTFREMAEQAYNQQQAMLVIHKGERANPLIVSVNSERNADQLRSDWCRSYAKDHGLMMIMA